jgi:hypothetical protein
MQLILLLQSMEFFPKFSECRLLAVWMWDSDLPLFVSDSLTR